MFVSGKDMFLCVLTCTYKRPWSLYAQLPLVFNKLHRTAGSTIRIVVSPLIALMKNQVRLLYSLYYSTGRHHYHMKKEKVWPTRLAHPRFFTDFPCLAPYIHVALYTFSTTTRCYLQQAHSLTHQTAKIY